MSKNEKKQYEIEKILKEFDKNVSTFISEDIRAILKKSGLTIKGAILKDPTIQINLSDDFLQLTATLRETEDLEMKKTYFEIDLLSSDYPKSSEVKKVVDKLKKHLKKSS